MLLDLDHLPPELLYHWPAHYPKLKNAESYRQYYSRLAIYAENPRKTIQGEDIAVTKNVSQPLVSFITVCYNAAKTVEQTIHSVLQQSYRHIEYLIIDGGSTDETKQIIEKYINYVSYYKSAPDLGVYDAMNQGVLCSEGEIVGIINADDWLEPDMVKNSLHSLASSNIAFSYGRYLNIRGSTPIGLSPEARVVDKHYYLKNDYPPNHPTLVVKKLVYDHIGLFRLDYKMAADAEFIRRMYFNNYQGAVVPGVLTNFRLGGLSGQNDGLFGKRELLRLRRQIYQGKSWLFDPFYLFHSFECNVTTRLPLLKQLRTHPALKPFRKWVKKTAIKTIGTFFPKLVAKYNRAL